MDEISRRGFLEGAVAALGLVVLGPSVAEAAKSAIPVQAPTALPNDAVVLTKDNIIDFIIECGQVLDEQNLPEDGRFVYLPPWACSMLKLSDLLRKSDLDAALDGRVGQIDRFIIYCNPHLRAFQAPGRSPAHGNYVVFGVKEHYSLQIIPYKYGEPIGCPDPELVKAQMWRVPVVGEESLHPS